MIKVKTSKTKNSSKGNSELSKLYKAACESKTEEFNWLAPGSYSSEDLIQACKVEKKLYRPLAKSFGLV